MDGETTVRPEMAVTYPANLSIMYANAIAVPDSATEYRRRLSYRTATGVR